MSFMISRYIDCEISEVHIDGNIGSLPMSTTFLSSSQRLKDSDGASIPGKQGELVSVVCHAEEEIRCTFDDNYEISLLISS